MTGFQSTPSVGRATCIDFFLPDILRTFQSTPSVGRATYPQICLISQNLFQSTPSVGRATVVQSVSSTSRSISIHALRGEGDIISPPFLSFYQHFNPRPPWGGRQTLPITKYMCAEFQSTPSVGRATLNMADDIRLLNDFNPRPPWGGRPAFTADLERISNFNPRPPWGGRPNIL